MNIIIDTSVWSLALRRQRMAPSAEARELADRYFFETLVRIHRAGEGAPYTGLKPAGRDLGPAVPAAVRHGFFDRLRGALWPAPATTCHS